MSKSMSASFERAHRITKREEFVRIYRQGRRLESSLFLIYILHGESPGAKLGLTLPKAVGNAVVRNRLKRMIREWFRQQKDHLHGLELVIQPNKTASELDFRDICEHLDLVLKTSMRQT